MALDAALNIFRAIGEETRLRIMMLLCRGELTVSEITAILGQSQPRVSRHLKILADAGLAERHREGAWMFYRAAPLSGQDPARQAVLTALGEIAGSGDRLIARDRDRFDQTRLARAAQATAYFEANAHEWSRLRQLHLPEQDIEARILALAGEGPIELFVDFGTGAGRMLEIFADRYEVGIGYDVSHEMLSMARATLDKAGIQHAQVRHGDIFAAPMDGQRADFVCVHQVLHYLAEPAAAVAEAARILKPKGKLLISDFAPHELEFLREEHAHRRLGFSDEEVAAWCDAAGLKLLKVETLSPAPSDKQKLTVKNWLCAAA